MTEPDSRAEFEKWHVSRYHDDYPFKSQAYWRHGDSQAIEYMDANIQTSWIAWQAARRSPVSGFAAGIEAAAKVCEESSDAAARLAGEALASDDSKGRMVLFAQHLCAKDLAARIRSLTPSPDAGVVEKVAVAIGETDCEPRPLRVTKVSDWLTNNDLRHCAQAALAALRTIGETALSREDEGEK